MDRIEKDKIIEKVCRKICENNNINPDKRICRLMPELLQPPFFGTYVIPDDIYQIPYWFIYREIVNEALAETFELIKPKC